MSTPASDAVRPWLAIGFALALLAVLVSALWVGVSAYRDAQVPIVQVDPMKDEHDKNKGDKNEKKPDPMHDGDRPEPLNCLRFSAEPAKVRSVQEAWARYYKTNVEREVDLRNGVKMKLTLIPPGKFRMGATKDEIDVLLKRYKSVDRQNFDREFPQHDVELTKGFWLGTYAVTQEEFDQVMGRNPSYFQKNGEGKDRLNGVITERRFPVEQVTWYDVVELCNKLSIKHNKKPCYLLKNEERKEGSIIKAEVSVLAGGTGFRLPTEAEWEYACRAGTTTPFHFGSTLNGKEANCDGAVPYGAVEPGPYLERTCPVGEYKPNAFGLFDMHGNVWQWCEDIYDAKFYRDEPIKDPKCVKLGEDGARVARGGSWFNDPWFCRAANRGWDAPSNRYDSVGCRLVLCLD